MTTLSITQKPAGKLRQLNIMRDLPKVADLVELCFHHNMDSEGKSYVQQMRRAGKNSNFLSWASTSMPLHGYVWEEDKKIVGNISIIPFREKGKTVFLLANIAVHPDYRRKGIAKTLTEKGMIHAQHRAAESIWVHVEENNPAAVRLYENLGFQTRLRRSTWNATSTLHPHQAPIRAKIIDPPARFWENQSQFLKRNYPQEMTWYRIPDWQNFKPGLKYWLYKLFVENDIRQWAIQKDGKLEAALIWKGTAARRSPLWLATAPQTDSASLAELLLHARFHLANKKRTLYIDFPADECHNAFEKAGFTLRRTLLWMRADAKR
ncbi:MAG: GNAT family N-acetyltransferase [Chloroflexi bacterium]|nr:GNAT family N-acetyltransferase [Chloroflexota bacterium]